jgi:hypothetical protein
MALPIAEGESLFGDFNVVLGFDNDPAVSVDDKPLTVFDWTCTHCGYRGFGRGPEAAFARMVEHARTHFASE